jgi:hypothetical protein
VTTTKLSLDLRAAVDADSRTGPYHVVVRVDPGAEKRIAKWLGVEVGARSRSVVAVVSYKQLDRLSSDPDVRLIGLSGYLAALR